MSVTSIWTLDVGHLRSLITPGAPGQASARRPRRRSSGTETSRLGRRDLQPVAPRLPQPEHIHPCARRSLAERVELRGRRLRAGTPQAPRRTGPFRPSSRAARSADRGRRRAPTPPAIAISARAQARPPSLMSWAARAAPSRTSSRTSASARATGSIAFSGSPSPSSPRSFASSEPASEGAKGPTSAISSPSRRSEPTASSAVGQLADHADDRGRVDRSLLGLVVEGDVAADHRDPELPAGVRKPRDRPVELPGDVRLLGVAEVEAVGEAEGLGADAGEVLRALEYRLDRAHVGLAGHPAAIAVDRDRDRPAGLRDHQHRRVGGLGPARGPRSDHRVVLLEGPARRGDVRGAEQGDHDRGGVAGIGRAPAVRATRSGSVERFP